MPYKDGTVRTEKQREYAAKHYLKNKKLIIARSAERRRKNKLIWETYKATLSCAQCGFMHPAAIDFHHVYPEEKLTSVYKLVNAGHYRQAHEEIKKCVPLCANCHRIHHHGEIVAKRAARKAAKKKGRSP